MYFPVADTVKPEEQYSSVAAVHPSTQQQLSVLLTKKKRNPKPPSRGLFSTSTTTSPLDELSRFTRAEFSSKIPRYQYGLWVIYAGGRFGGRGSPSVGVREQPPPSSR